MADLIAAIATPPGVGAISLIRVSGAGALEALRQRICRPSGAKLEVVPRRAHLCHVKDGEGVVIDEVVLTFYPNPASFTGEDVVEIAGHGGVLVTQRVLESCLECGIRTAREGEFSERAFMNGKLDLTQAEAVMDLIAATSDIAIRSAREQLSGGISDAMQGLRSSLIGVLGELEAYIDFPEEDIDPEVGERYLARIRSAVAEVGRMIESEERGRMIREGVRTAIVGRPNAGKSLLLNQLLGFDRAIVSDVAGTTRDTVEEVIHLGGVAVRLIDTAGLREASDEIERQGIERSRRQIEAADVILSVVDGSEPRKDASHPVDTGKVIRVINKADLGLHPDFAVLREGEVRLSSKTGEGMEDLISLLRGKLVPALSGQAGQGVAVNARHRDCLRRAKEALTAADESFAGGQDPEFVAMDLREALEAIGEVTGVVDTEEILGEIFGKFCIGK